MSYGTRPYANWGYADFAGEASVAPAQGISVGQGNDAHAAGLGPVAVIPNQMIFLRAGPDTHAAGLGPNIWAQQILSLAGPATGAAGAPITVTAVVSTPTLSSTLSTGSPITSLPVNALVGTLAAGTVVLTSGSVSQEWQTTGAAAGATSVPVTSQSPNFAYAAGTPLASPSYGGRIKAELFDHTNTTNLGEMTGRWNVNWLDPLNDTGTGALNLQNDDTMAPSLNYLQVVRFSLDGSVRFASIIEKMVRHSVDPDEEFGQFTEISGRGLLAALERALLYPETALDSPISTYDSRLFSFASKYYDASAWPAAVLLKQQKATGTPYDKDGAPSGWPDGDAYWIWGVPMNFSASPPAPVGDCYFVAPAFTNSSESTYRFFISADDGYELYVDGALVSYELYSFLWAETKTVDVFLPAGTHRIAIKGINLDRPINESSNVAGVICSVFRLDGLSLGINVMRTDATWKASAYPTVAPGLSLGAILRVMVTEAQARGALTGLSLGFTDTTDSAGESWPVVSGLKFDTGTDLLTCFKQLTAYCDLQMLPASFRLNAYVRRGSTTSATLTPGVNLTELVHEGQA